MDSVGQLSRIAWKERKFSVARKDSVEQEENMQGILDAIKDVVLMDEYVVFTITCL